MSRVCLAWATRVRHIAVDGSLLCFAKSKTGGYAVSNGAYNTIALSGLPTRNKNEDDTQYTHTDGFIEFLPIENQNVKINVKSVCKKCLGKYERLFKGEFNNEI